MMVAICILPIIARNTANSGHGGGLSIYRAVTNCWYSDYDDANSSGSSISHGGGLVLRGNG